MKKSALLYVVMCLLAFVVNAQICEPVSDFEENGIYYKITSHTAPYTAAVASSLPKRYSGSVVIPESVTYNGITYKVTAIAKGAFWCCRDLTSVTIPNTVVVIQESAFVDCIGLKSLSVPNSVKIIEKEAFSSCTGLETLTIGRSLARIDSAAFAYTKKLSHIEVSAQNTHFKVVDDVLYSASMDILVLYPAAKKGVFTVPKKVVAIGNSAFCGCEGLTGISFHNNLRSIGETAFLNCSSLYIVCIPKRVRNIAHSAFGFCSSLSAFVVDAINRRYTATDGVLYTKHMDTLVAFPAGRKVVTYNIPSTVTTIGENAFWGCEIAYIDLPCSVKTVDDYAFHFCTLEKITFGQSLESVGNFAFGLCQNLKSVALPNSLKEIGKSAFAVCNSLTDVLIGDSVKKIGEGAFSGCEKLSSVIFGKSVDIVEDMAFLSCKSLERLVFKGQKPPTFGLTAFYLMPSSDAVTVPMGNGKSKKYIPNAPSTDVIVPCGAKNIYSERLAEWYDDVQEDCE